MFTATPFVSCCCIAVARSYSYGRWPQPLKKSWSNVAFNAAVPNAGLLEGPHSPFARAFAKSHCGTKSPLSVHVRVAVVAALAKGWSGVPPVTAATYLPRFPLIADPPFANMSYLAPYQLDTVNQLKRGPLIT